MSASIGFHRGAKVTYHENQGTRWMQFGEPDDLNVHASVFLKAAAEHRSLAAQLREAADTLDSVADELDRIENPCESCNGDGEVNSSWNNDLQQSRDCSACGATGVASV